MTRSSGPRGIRAAFGRGTVIVVDRITWSFSPGCTVPVSFQSRRGSTSQPMRLKRRLSSSTILSQADTTNADCQTPCTD